MVPVRANIMECPERVVEGMLYDIEDAGLAKLDYYEGYPREYRRLTVAVETKMGNFAGVIAYKATEKRERTGLVPPRTYVQHLLAARDVLSPAYTLEIEAWLERAV